MTQRLSAAQFQALYGSQRTSPPPQARSYPKLQEQQNAHSGKANHRPKEAEEDGRDHPRFEVSVDLLVSDERRRDADGALSTLLDCLVQALRKVR